MRTLILISLLLLLATPAVASNLTADQAGNSVTLAWDANTEPDLAGYRIYQSRTAGGPYTQIGQVGVMPAPEWTVTGLTNGTYFWVVTARNLAGMESGYSNEVSKTISLPPAPPKNLIIRILQAIASAIVSLFGGHRIAG